MPRPRPPHLHRLTSRHGKITWYVQLRRGAPRIRIRAEYGTTAFNEAYAAAIRTAPTRPVPKIRAAAGTVEWAWISYKHSSAWKALSGATQRQRDGLATSTATRSRWRPRRAKARRRSISPCSMHSSARSKPVLPQAVVYLQGRRLAIRQGVAG
jgi:hypothetical protein